VIGEVLHVFCRLPITHGTEQFYVVVGIHPAMPGKVIVQANDDNDYHDERFPSREIDAAAGIEFRAENERYSWEVAMIEAEQELRERLNG